MKRLHQQQKSKKATSMNASRWKWETIHHEETLKMQ